MHPSHAFEPARKPLVAEDETGQRARQFLHGCVIVAFLDAVAWGYPILLCGNLRR
jgi:hypothetical protein